jgi:acetyltransferase-like isoleucine patch superfamily enzyme
MVSPSVSTTDAARSDDGDGALPAIRHHGNDLGEGGAVRSVGAAALNYLTNHVVNHVPSYTVRHEWYRRVMGLHLARSATVQMGVHLWSYGPGNLRRRAIRIGDRTIVNRGCTLDARDAVAIGNDVSISPEVVILTTQHGVDDPAFGLESRPVVIEDNVFIGMRAIVMPGVRIGRAAVVAAGAVVTRDVAPFDIVAGVPARSVGRRSGSADYRLEGRSALFE